MFLSERSHGKAKLETLRGMLELCTFTESVANLLGSMFKFSKAQFLGILPSGFSNNCEMNEESNKSAEVGLPKILRLKNLEIEDF